MHSPRIIVTLFTFLFFFILKADAQEYSDTIYANQQFLLSSRFKKENVKGTIAGTHYDHFLLDSITIKTNTEDILNGSASSFRVVRPYWNKKQKLYNFPIPLEISSINAIVPTNSQIFYPDKKWDTSPTFIIPDEFTFKNSTSNGLISLNNISISGDEGKMNIKNIIAHGVTIYRLHTKDLNIDSLSAGIFISNSQIDRISISKINTSNPGGLQKITIANCHLGEIIIEGATIPPIQLYQDSITQYITFNDQAKQMSLLDLRNCYFDGYFMGKGRINKIIFENTRFGSNADLTYLNCDTVIFKNCGLLPQSLPLSFMFNTKGTSLCIINSDFQDVRFSFREYNRLIFLDGRLQQPTYFDDMDRDGANSTYQMLLEKFKREGKLDSYEFLDIDYTLWKAEHGTPLTKITTAFSWAWWYYGYRKWNIIQWTFVFIFLFYWFNYSYWHKIRNTYPIIPDNLNKKHTRSHVFFYTILVFFSLRIDFDKLNYANRIFVYLFFIQYFTGLICLFFIFNAIIKI